MKTKRASQFIKSLKRGDPFAIPPADWPNENEVAETISGMASIQRPDRDTPTSPGGEFSLAHKKALVSIANNLWRAKKRVLDPETGEVREEMKRVDRHLDAIRRDLEGIGLTVRDHTNDVYDEGQPMMVIATKPTAGLDKKRVSETLLPSIFWNGRLVQNGEIEIATPIAPNNSSDT
jgi:hypothetical protein